MSSYAPGGAGRSRATVDAGRLWGGGVAASLVAGLVALAGVLVLQGVFDIELVPSVLLLDVAGWVGLDYAVTALVLTLLATGTAHALAVMTPQPRMFFSWIVGVATVCGAAVPFALDADLVSQVATAALHVVLGVCVSSLVGAVLSRVVHRR